MMNSGHILHKRLQQFLRRHALVRQRPHGLISIHYLRPEAPPAIAEHRRLWLSALPGLPRPLFFALELWLWLRWIFYGAWRQSFHLLRRRGPEIRKEEGIGLLRQAVRTLGPALCHTLAPRDVYRFRLYRRERLRRWPDYVYDHELPAFHARRSARLGGPDPESLKLLQDKVRFGEQLARHGLSTIPVLEVVPRDAPFNLERHLKHHERLFCKTRSGNQARGAFVVGKGEHGDARLFKTCHGGLADEPCSETLLREQLEPDDYLIQPFLSNHPALAALAGTDDAVTVRYITKCPVSNHIQTYCALLEVPVATQGSCAVRKGRHIILPIDRTTGKVEPFPETWLCAGDRARFHYIVTELLDRPLPYWEELGQAAGKAHALFPTIHAIAWDFIISRDGPLLLEGNAGWGATVPQQLRGGLIGEQEW